MKKLCLFFFICLFAVSCEIKDKVESTPQIAFPSGSIAFTNGEKLTLSSRIINKEKQYYIDTLVVGDTVIFSPVVTGGYNNLIEFKISSTNYEAVKFVWDKDLIDEYMLDSSNEEEGYFYLKDNIKKFNFSFFYVVKEVDKELYMTLETISDAGEKRNKHTVLMKTPTQLTRSAKK